MSSIVWLGHVGPQHAPVQPDQLGVQAPLHELNVPTTCDVMTEPEVITPASARRYCN